MKNTQNKQKQRFQSSILNPKSLNLKPMLFVAKKPLFISSNNFLNQIKKNTMSKKLDLVELLILLQQEL